MSRHPVERTRILVAFAAIAYLGLGAGAAGVLLPPQGADYGVSKATISLIFISFAIGYIISALANGSLIHRLGLRSHLISGTAVSAVALAAMALRPSFVMLLVCQVGFGYGAGALDAGLNAYLSMLDRNTALLNVFHAFFGVGALIGPAGAAKLIDTGFTWPFIYAVLAVLAVLLLAAFTSYPSVVREDEPVPRPRLSSALGHRVVWIGAAFLGVYVGIETAIGNWGFSFLTEDRGFGLVAAGWVISGYWGGLTLGRFVLNAAAERVGLGVIGLNAVCIAGIGLGTAAVWLTTSLTATTVGLVVVGFFLGPLFPTMIASVPRLIAASIVATTVGILVATSIAGSALFPWIVGFGADLAGSWVLLPITIVLAALLGVVWWRISVRLAAAQPVPSHAQPAHAQPSHAQPAHEAVEQPASVQP